jgi:hypothetical protein
VGAVCVARDTLIFLAKVCAALGNFCVSDGRDCLKSSATEILVFAYESSFTSL